MLAVLLLAIAAAELSLSAVVLRAGWDRRDNRWFAFMGLIDGGIAVMRASFVWDGYGVADPASLYACIAPSIIMGAASVGFTYSFPFDRKLPRLAHVANFGAAAATIILALHPATRDWFRPRTNLFYFVPCGVITSYFAYRAFRQAKRASGRSWNEGCAGAALVLGAIVFRWVSGISAHWLVRKVSPGSLEAAILFDSTVSVLVGEVLIGWAVFRHQLFRMRGVVAEMVGLSATVLAALGLVAIGVEAALSFTSGGAALRAALIAVAIAPAALMLAVSSLGKGLEGSLLRPLDPRRALLEQVEAEAISTMAGKTDPAEMVAIVEEAAARAAGEGGSARFVPGPAFPLEVHAQAGLQEALEEHLAGMKARHLHVAEAGALPDAVRAGLTEARAELLVPVRRNARLYGAVAIAKRRIDRDLVKAAVSLGEHLALKLENAALFGEKLRLEKELDESRRLAALGSFAAAIAHDIRTPLTSVQMNVQILRGKAKLPPDDMEHFDIALEELARLNAQVQEILDYAKPVQIQPSPIEPRALADEAAKAVELILSDRRLKLERDDEPGAPAVLADRARMRQVLLNLLDNAAHASSLGAEIKLSTRPSEDGRVALEVSDRGKDIPPEVLPNIFEPFYTTKPDGTGLGLAIAQKLVRAHGGEIRVRSAPGAGATFTILLPAAPHAA